MKKWLIVYDCGYGDAPDVIEAETHKEAVDVAYEAWREAAENSAKYCAEEITTDNLENYGFDPEDYGLKRSD